jgi:hypothetical protein
MPSSKAIDRVVRNQRDANRVGNKKGLRLDPEPLAPKGSLRLGSARTRRFPLFDLILPPGDPTSTEHQPLRE